MSREFNKNRLGQRPTGSAGPLVNQVRHLDNPEDILRLNHILYHVMRRIQVRYRYPFEIVNYSLGQYMKGLINSDPLATEEEKNMLKRKYVEKKHHHPNHFRNIGKREIELQIGQ